MKHQYRRVKVMNSNGPDEESRQEWNERPNGQRHIWVEQPRKSPVGRWVVGICALFLIVIGLLWMQNVSSSLHHIGQTAAANSKAIQHQSTQLSGIQNSLNDIRLQLHYLENQIQNIFTFIVSKLK